MARVNALRESEHFHSVRELELITETDHVHPNAACAYRGPHITHLMLNDFVLLSGT